MRRWCSPCRMPDAVARRGRKRLVSPWLARKDTDWYVDRLYSFAGELGATVIRTLLSRTVIDVNRDPEGRSLYPGQATTELCPTTTFDGEPLYPAGREPDARGIAARRARYYAPYHAPISNELARLRKTHDTVVLFDAHSIRSVVPRLFEGTLPVFNLGNQFRTELRAGARSIAARYLCRERIADGRRRSVQGRLHHAPVRSAGERGARRTARARDACLPRRAHDPFPRG